MKKLSAPYKNKFRFKRNNNTGKNDYGRITIIGGSYGMAGAVMLAANSCMRSGAGLTYIFIPDKIYDIVASGCVCSVIHPCESKDGLFGSGSAKKIVNFCNSRTTAVCIGPGLNIGKGPENLVNEVVKKVSKPLIVDADGLNQLDKKELKKRKYPTILTPHAGEFSRLTSTPKTEIEKNREKSAVSFAKKYKVVLVLKGFKTVVTDGERTYINKTGNPGMATGGSGDSLAGIIPTLVSVMDSPFEAACLSVYIHGLAGDVAAQKLTQVSMTAWDIVNCIPEAFKRIF